LRWGSPSAKKTGKSVIKTVQAEPVWEKAGPSWSSAAVASGTGPFKVGDRIVGVGKRAVKTEAEFRDALGERAGSRR